MKQTLFYFLLGIFTAAYSPVISAIENGYTVKSGGKSYQYSVTKTGDNFTFKFATSPEDPVTKLIAGRHVLLSIYKDSSIQKTYTEDYLRERARCFVFDSHFYTYTLCFLPNDFDIKNNDRFWGFVTQVPNWKWLVSRVLVPVLFAFGVFFYAGNRSRTKS